MTSLMNHIYKLCLIDSNEIAKQPRSWHTWSSELGPTAIEQEFFVSGGFRSQWSARVFVTIATVLQTAQKRGQDALTTLTSALGPCIDWHLLLQPP